MEDIIIAIPVLLGIFTFVVVLVGLTNRNKERLARLGVLEQILRDPANDNATRQEAIRGLDGRGASVGAWWQWLRTNVARGRVFGASARGLIVSGGLILALGNHYDFEAGVATLVAGIAILALPQIMRELDARSAQRS